MNELKNKHKGERCFIVCNGPSLTKKDLAKLDGEVTFGTNLIFENMTPDAYLELQRKINGEFLGPIIAGIYTKIRNGEFHLKSDYEKATGRKHISWREYFRNI